MDSQSYEKRFDSLLALSNFIESNDDKINPRRDTGFEGTRPLQEARDILKRGGYDEDSGKIMDDHKLDSSKFPAREGLSPVPRLDVMGYRPNVAAFLAGSPLSMVRNMPEAMPDKRIKILVASTASWVVEESAMQNRGAAVMGAIEHLCAEGFSVELTVGFFMSRETRQAEGVFLPITVKHYQDTFDPAALGYVLTDPSFSRRALFAAVDILIEQNPDNEPLQDMVGGMGYPMTSHLDSQPYDIVFEALHAHDRWTPSNSADKAMTKVYEWLERSKVAA